MEGVTMILWALGGLALRAEPQMARKARQSILSSSIASASICWMSLACDCWIRQACEAPRDSTSLMAVEQQFSASAKALAQSASASLIQTVCWISASLINTMQQASISLMVQVQRVFAVLWLQWPQTHYGKGPSQNLRLLSSDEHQ